jgi:hypothetical protein
VHLVHGANRADKRHEMMSDLIRNLKIHRDELDPDVLADFSFILGDLNYRMNSTYLELAPQIDKILELKVTLDQLHLAMATQGRYPAYVEFPITFKPTYKRSKVDHSQYHNKKNQAPSYTDRILYRNNNSTEGSTEGGPN